MNWQAVIDKLFLESLRAYEEAKSVATPGEKADPAVTIMLLVQGYIAGSRGDILRAMALSLREGLKEEERELRHFGEIPL